MKAIFSSIGGMAVAIALVTIILYGSFEAYKFFKPRYMAVDNQAFLESQQYNDGMLRDLENWKMEYVNGDEVKKDSIRAIVLHRFSVYPKDRLPVDLRQFYEQLQAGNQ